jgi:hypothetical protein
MFYLLQKKEVKDVAVGERCMVLADFAGVPAGAMGKISENYGTGVMVSWEWDRTVIATNMPPKSDGFAEDELCYLRFETEKKPPEPLDWYDGFSDGEVAFVECLLKMDEIDYDLINAALIACGIGGEIISKISRDNPELWSVIKKKIKIV